jgi:cystathionine beta-lyase/cystathionine gamma-synthase
VEEVRQKMMVWGQAPDPFACWLLERGLKTLDVRVRRQNESAMRIAEWATERKEIQRVHYAGLTSHPDHRFAQRLMSGFGGMLGLELAGGGKAADRFLKRLKLIKHAPSLGGVETIVSEPRHTSHAHLSASQRAAMGVPDGFVRLSVGIEDADDLIEDLSNAVH